MARGQTNKLYRTFAKGLITEAGFLTYPEDASSDELNTVIHRKGNRSRRFGIDYEPNATAVELADYTNEEVTVEYIWRAVSEKSNIHFLCVQIGNIIHFFDANSEPLSDGKKDFTIDLEDYAAPTGTPEEIRSSYIQMVSGKGFLFVVQEHIDPICVEYDPETDEITVTKVLIQIRDFDGVYDGLANDEEPPTLSKEHHYNLRNQGWIEPGTAPASSTIGTGGGYVDVGEQTQYDPHTGEGRQYVRSGEEIP